MNATAPATEPAQRFRRMTPADAADLILRHRLGVLPHLALFDMRDAVSFTLGHIPGAVHLTERHFGAALRDTPRTTPVLLYCYRGNASQMVARMFGEFRFHEVYSVDGGYDALRCALAEREAPRPLPALPPEASPALRDFIAEHRFAAANLDAPGASTLTPLMRAALMGRADLVRELLAVGVAINARNGDGNNALWLACVAHSAEAVAALVTAGIHLDNRNDLGATCLMLAASSGKADMVEALLKAGANPDITNFDDARAVDLCANLACLRLLRHTLAERAR